MPGVAEGEWRATRTVLSSGLHVWRDFGCVCGRTPGVVEVN